MNEISSIIHIGYDGNEKLTVSGRELHQALEIKTRYNDWFTRMCEYGFSEGFDFYSILSKTHENGRPSTDHSLNIDMAKEICMIQRSEIGKQCRQYFLEIEKRWNSPEAVMARALKMANNQLQEATAQIKTLQTAISGQKAYIHEIEPKARFCDDVLKSETLLSVTDIAKDYGMSAVELNSYLEENGVQFKKSGKWYLYHQFAKCGYAQSKTHVSQSGRTVTTHTYWTQKGRLFIHELLKSDGIYPIAEREQRQANGRSRAEEINAILERHDSTEEN